MVVGVLRLTLLVHESGSLKDKRQVIKSLVGKVRGRFNVAIAETGDNDLWQRAEVGVVAVGNDKAFVNSVLDKVLDFVEELCVAEVSGTALELIDF